MSALLLSSAVVILPSSSTSADAATGSATSGDAESLWAETVDAAMTDVLADLGPDSSVPAVDLDVALDIVGPLSGLTGPDDGPALEAVMATLGDVHNDLASVSARLDRLSAQALTRDAASAAGTCTATAQRLEPLLAAVEEAHDGYSSIVSDLGSLRGPDDVAELERHVGTFVESVGGPAAGGDVAEWALSDALGEAQTDLKSVATTPGVIEACGESGLAQWRSETARSVATQPLDQPGAWFDDTPYYEPVRDLVTYWQTIQAHALFLVQQAAVLEAGRAYTAGVGSPTLSEADDICPTASGSSDPGASSAARICSTALSLTTATHQDLISQWKQAGLAYTDDDVVLVLGSDLTGLTFDGRSTASALWARTPSDFPGSSGPWIPVPSGFGGQQDFAGFSGWEPANADQWADLSHGYQASHPASPSSPVVVTQTYTDANGRDQYAAVGAQPFAPIDVLAAMRAMKGEDGTASFEADPTGFAWIPGETASADFGYTNGPAQGLTFPTFPQNADGPLAPRWQYSESPYYSGPGLSVLCMVAPVDGVICGDTVASWWVARQQSIYTYQANALELGSYWGLATYSVTPGGGIEAFSVSGETINCDDDDPCGIGIDDVSSVPAWMSLFVDDNGDAWTPPADEGTYWPAAALPSGDGCTTVWGVPSRCGDAFAAWVSENIPDPEQLTPVPESVPTISSADAGTAVCNAPGWQPVSQEIVYGDVVWSAAFASEGTAPALMSLPYGQPIELADLLGSTAPAGTSASVSCSVSASNGSIAGVSTVQGLASVATWTGDGWALSAFLPSRALTHPESVEIGEGGTVSLHASAAYAVSSVSAYEPRSRNEEPASVARTVMSVPSSAPGSPGPSIVWERRAPGSSAWVPVTGGTDSLIRTGGLGTPRVLRIGTASTSLTLSAVDRGQHDESYRAVFTFADGRIETAQAQLRVRPGGTAGLADTGVDSPEPLLGVASIALLLGLMLCVQARRRRSSRSGS